MESSNRRLTLFEHMSAVDNGRNTLAALTLEAILGNAQRPPQQPSTTPNRTLLEIILDDGSNKDKTSWKTLRDKLRLGRAGSSWTSSVHVPASDVNVRSDRSQLSRRGSFGSNPADSTRVEDEGGGERVAVSDPPVLNLRLQLARRDSFRFGHNPLQTDHSDSADISMPSDAQPSRSFRPQINRHHSTRLHCSNTAINDADSSDDDSPLSHHVTRQLGAALAEERELSAREEVAAQEAAAAAAAAVAEQAAAAENNAPPIGAAEEPVRMSLMELLEETNRQMEQTGSSYTMGDDGDEFEHEEGAEEEEVVVEQIGGIEYACCVCMVRHKGAAFIPCGHTFCRLCSRELWVQRGNCPLCNGSILEILDIF